ncbi:MAG: thioredoxin family protein [Pseudomonadota bacterium]|nr:thioredoxin family protein [Pseudomonadota bacterium]
MKQLVAALSLLLSLTGPVLALEKQPFTPERFAEIQEKDEVVLIDVYAPWCPTCAKQQEALTAWASANPDKNLHVLVVDYDNDKEWVRHFRAPRQSTLLLYRGKDQFWYSVAETRPEVIAAEINKAFNFERRAP